MLRHFMSMTYHQNFKLSLWDKLVFGLVVVIATMIGSLITDEIKQKNAESLKSVEKVVSKYEEYSLLLDKHRYSLEEIERDKDYLEMLFLFDKNKTNEEKDLKDKI